MQSLSKFYRETRLTLQHAPFVSGRNRKPRVWEYTKSYAYIIDLRQEMRGKTICNRLKVALPDWFTSRRWPFVNKSFYFYSPERGKWNDSTMEEIVKRGEIIYIFNWYTYYGLCTYENVFHVSWTCYENTFREIYLCIWHKVNCKSMVCFLFFCFLLFFLHLLPGVIKPNGAVERADMLLSKRQNESHECIYMHIFQGWDLHVSVYTWHSLPWNDNYHIMVFWIHDAYYDVFTIESNRAYR